MGLFTMIKKCVSEVITWVLFGFFNNNKLGEFH